MEGRAPWPGASDFVATRGGDLSVDWTSLDENHDDYFIVFIITSINTYLFVDIYFFLISSTIIFISIIIVIMFILYTMTFFVGFAKRIWIFRSICQDFCISAL